MTNGVHKINHVNGWVILDKPYAMTSTSAVGKVRRLLKAEKAGHAGTLDPLATGVLPIALGEATKTANLIQSAHKTYEFMVKWGESTDTDDMEGSVVQTCNHIPSTEEILQVLPNFNGQIMQRPPCFSAIRVGGERAYKLARNNEVFELAPRIIEILEISLIENADGQARFRVSCSKGTYIRSLARDIAIKLGSLGHIIQLRRLSVGHFCTTKACTLEEIAEKGAEGFLIPIEEAFPNTPQISLTENQAKLLMYGQTISVDNANLDGPTTCLAANAGKAIAITLLTPPGILKPVRILNISNPHANS